MCDVRGLGRGVVRDVESEWADEARGLAAIAWVSIFGQSLCAMKVGVMIHPYHPHASYARDLTTVLYTLTCVQSNLKNETSDRMALLPFMASR